MNPLYFPKRAAAVAFGLLALASAGAAQARSDVYFSIGVQPSHVYVEPQPVYVQPQPVYVQPRPVYAQPQPVYVQPRPVYVQPQPGYGPHGGYGPRPGYGSVTGYQGGGRRGPWGDHDGDGVPNLHDPDHPRNQWRQVEREQHRYRY
jgi:hypothetical protein